MGRVSHVMSAGDITMPHASTDSHCIATSVRLSCMCLRVHHTKPHNTTATNEKIVYPIQYH